MIPVVMIIIFSFQTYGAIRMKKLDVTNWTLINFFGTQDYEYLTRENMVGISVGKTTFHSTLKGLAPIFRAASTVL